MTTQSIIEYFSYPTVNELSLAAERGDVGEATKYVTRNKACRMLQLNLPQFRKLCILKGVYPREPKSRKKAQRGDSNIKTLFLKNDIVYLTHEPIIWKIRDEKIHRREVKTLRCERRSKEANFKIALQRPVFKLDHIVLERYPSFDKALGDLDDALSAMFLYSAMPKELGIDAKMVHECRKLTTEFLNYVIESRSLTKTFISIRGYFYRAHIMGEKVTWMVPHPFPPQGSKDVEMRIVKVFIDFYCTYLGFVNYRLYQSLNLYYPPKLAMKVERLAHTSKDETIVNIISSLNTKFKRDVIDDDAGEEEYDRELITDKFDKKLKMAQEEKEKVKQQQNLFSGVKFFLGRETNRESLTLVIRSAGGLVSWDESLGPGFTFPEDDSTISYQIVDRPKLSKQNLSRYYVQPQWVYDSFNGGVLLPVQNYFVGTSLPAHLSPFEEAYHKLYEPPEMERLKALQDKIDIVGDKTIEELRQEIELQEEEDEEEMENESENKGEHAENYEEAQEESLAVLQDQLEDEEEDPLAKMKVRPGKPQKVSLVHQQKLKELEDFRLAASFVHRKQKRFFKKILNQEKKAKRYSGTLKRKRIIYEREMQNRRKVEMQEAAKKNKSMKN